MTASCLASRVYADAESTAQTHSATPATARGAACFRLSELTAFSPVAMMAPAAAAGNARDEVTSPCRSGRIPPGGLMRQSPSACGISREEYHAAVRRCPANPAFDGSYEAWVEATLKEVEKLGRQIKKAPADSKL